MSSTAVILGSAFEDPILEGIHLTPVQINTTFGQVPLHRFGEDRWVLFRHGLPHRYLPHQIPYRAQIAALQAVDCQALLVTSSVSILDRAVPLDTPLRVGDLVMLENRLPDGTNCSMFGQLPAPGQGHLVLDEGLISSRLDAQLAKIIQRLEFPDAPAVVFAYAPGPRTKTAAENALFASWGMQTNSMTLAPEIVLANECEIPSAAVVVGHKYSVPGVTERLDRSVMKETLDTGQDLLGRVARAFLEQARPVPFANHLYRY